MIRYNEDLSKHCTLHIGGMCDRYYIPENLDELKNILAKEQQYYIISGGSNLLINDKKHFPCVIDMKEINKEFICLENGRVFVGSSLRIQKVINKLQEMNMGGFEFLYSLPALFGGIICMNAGRGSDKKSISEYIQSIKYMDEYGEVHEIEKKDCEFSYRKSIFQNRKWIILGAVLACENISAEESRRLVQERVEFCKQRQDMRYKNAGSTFSKYNQKIMKVIRLISKITGRNNKVCFSNKTLNWLNNKGNGTYAEAIKSINRVKLIHKLFMRRIEVEYIIWD